MDQNSEITCSCGAVNAATSKFCRECGAKLAKEPAQENPFNPQQAGMGMTMQSGNAGMPMQGTPVKKELPPFAPEDKHLKVLVDVFASVGPLAGGIERRNELVLYRDEANSSYEVHSYSSDGYTPEHHSAYSVDAELAENILQTIKKNNYADLDNEKETPICGGSKVLKFLDDKGEMLRLCAGEGPIREAHNTLYAMLRAGTDAKRRIVSDYAKNWKRVHVDSSGMAATDNYHFELERSPEGQIRICPKTGMSAMAANAGMMGELTEEESAAVNAIPLGAMFSATVTQPVNAPSLGQGMMSGMGMMGMQSGMNGMAGGMSADAGAKRCTVVYADDQSDEKVWDGEALAELVGIVRKYL